MAEDEKGQQEAENKTLANQMGEAAVAFAKLIIEADQKLTKEKNEKNH